MWWSAPRRRRSSSRPRCRCLCVSCLSSAPRTSGESEVGAARPGRGGHAERCNSQDRQDHAALRPQALQNRTRPRLLVRQLSGEEAHPQGPPDQAAHRRPRHPHHHPPHPRAPARSASCARAFTWSRVLPATGHPHCAHERPQPAVNRLVMTTPRAIGEPRFEPANPGFVPRQPPRVCFSHNRDHRLAGLSSSRPNRTAF